MILKIKGNKIWFVSIGLLFAVTLIISIRHLATHEILKTTISENTQEEMMQLNKSTQNTKKSDLNNMRGVWIPYFSLETEEYDETSFKSNFDNLITTAKKNKMNTVIVHIRPFSDALYQSNLFPTSHILTGEQGEHIDYDPLAYMIKKTHESGMSFHAWINPYRIRTNGTPETLFDDGIMSKLSENDILNYNEGLYINPSSAEGRKLITEGVKEVVENYDVDGIQFDDYFYPDSDFTIDRKYYEAYLSECDSECIPLSQSEWRKANVDMLISGVYGCIKQIDRNIIFGISPQGNISNCNEIGADVQKWCNTYGYMDYICPQMYVNFEHSVLPFDKMLKQWQELTKDKKVTLCAGLALYKANSDYDEGSWKNNDDILKKEVVYCKEQGIDNFMIYDIDYFYNENAEEEVQNMVNVL